MDNSDFEKMLSDAGFDATSAVLGSSVEVAKQLVDATVDLYDYSSQELPEVMARDIAMKFFNMFMIMSEAPSGD